jgi:hypothetical protein
MLPCGGDVSWRECEKKWKGSRNPRHGMFLSSSQFLKENECLHILSLVNFDAMNHATGGKGRVCDIKKGSVFDSDDRKRQYQRQISTKNIFA